ncbi:LysR Transcriptional regulator [Burkholderiaceae bacterium]
MHSEPSLSHIKFRHLILMQHLVEFGSLHKAAKHLSISQPAASAMLREFEKQLGLTLFLRTTQGVVPTEASSILVNRAQTILNEFDALVHEVKQLNKNLSPLLRVGVVPQALFAYLPRVIELFREADGGAVSIQEGTAKHLLLQLFEGKLDCVIGRLSGAAMPSMHNTDELIFFPLYSENICIVEGTKEAKKRKNTFEDLAKRDWVLPRADSSLRQQLTDSFLRRGLMLPEPVIETTNYFQSLTMLSGSNLCSVIPQSAADMHVKLGNIRVIDIPNDLKPMPVSFILRTSAKDNTQVSKFRRIFTDLSTGIGKTP